MMEKEELYARIEELERELAEERIRRKITEDNSDCALWEYEIASKKYVLSRKLGGKWNTTNMVIENYQEQMHNWGFVHPDDWATFDEFCAAMDRGDEHISYEVRQVSSPELTRIVFPSKNTITSATTIFAPEEIPSTKGPAMGLWKNV